MQKKLNKLSKQFPNIFRFIPESKILKILVKSDRVLNASSIASLFVSVVILVLILLTVSALYMNILSLININNTRKEVVIKRNFWQSISKKYDGYKDAYFQLAVQEYKLGNYSRANESNAKALLLDPNFVEAKKLEELLNRR